MERVREGAFFSRNRARPRQPRCPHSGRLGRGRPLPNPPRPPPTPRQTASSANRRRRPGIIVFCMNSNVSGRNIANNFRSPENPMAQRGVMDSKKPTKNATTLFEAGAPLVPMHSTFVRPRRRDDRRCVRRSLIQQPERDCARRTEGGSGKQRPIREVQPEGQPLVAHAPALHHGDPHLGATVGMPSSPGTGARAVTPSGGPNGGWRASVGRRSGGATQMALLDGT